MGTEAISSREIVLLSNASSNEKPSLVIEPTKGLFHVDLLEIWKHRELLYFLIWRDIKVKYKQTVIGASWAIIQPVMTMIIFTVIFGNFANIPSDGIPYPIFAYTALLPWTYFSQAVTRTSLGVLGNSVLITKVYFPRLIIPIASAVAPLIEFCLSFLVLTGLMAWFNVVPTWGIVLLPLFLLLALFTALGVGLFLSALHVRYRDVGHSIGFLIQFWMYASPVIYPLSLVPEGWRFLYSLNPMVGVIEGFRWAILGKVNPDLVAMGLSGGMVVTLLALGILYFNRMERYFADVI
ncbi:ABC transporter permease [Candidatus Nitronereus thalassa]|uniref:Transport permease protein n=1 Tax=Candidatus Nitronereus thalassa TaxID=3020898 RepID=A0ABU3K576_9BACT|nr:ABC transporter permease [Candidatus Nitronereus thalassa]MDT7041551.1 ABC transporter permease [Candidatus Nitronereus thalassa]